jgi:hypothetical protein
VEFGANSPGVPGHAYVGAETPGNASVVETADRVTLPELVKL